MKSVQRLFLLVTLSSSAIGQTYTVQTVAGGGQGLPAKLGDWDIACAAIDAQGNVFMTVANYNIVVRRDSKGGLSRVAGNFEAGFAGDGEPALKASFNGPAGIAVAPDGALYIVDALNNRIRKVTDGIITTVTGNGSQGFSGDGGPAVDAALYLPTFVALDAAGALYISDAGNARIRRVSNGIITTVAGNGIRDYFGDGGPATRATLVIPTGLVFDANGSLYIADYGSHTVRVVANGVMSTAIGNGVPGYNGEGRTPTSAQINRPLGLTVSAAGELYVADSGNNRVRKVTDGILATVLGDYPPFAPASMDILRTPASVAVDDNGIIYIADEDHQRVVTLSNESSPSRMICCIRSWVSGRRLSAATAAPRSTL